MAPPGFTFRPATPDDSAVLTEITFRAKASHGYDEAFMSQILDDMVIPADTIGRDTMMIALAGGRALGFAHLMPIDREDTIYLENLYIDPDAQGLGVGRALFDWALDEARRRGYAWLEWDSDPNASEFYVKMGGVKIGETESATFPGRVIPKFRKATVLEPAPDIK